MAKVSVGKVSEIPVGTLKAAHVEGKDEIVLANVGGTIYAMRGVCNHEGGPLPEGTLEETVITCPWHGAKWDVATGKCAEFPIDLDPEPTYPVTVEGDEIYIEI
ncbi:MAG: Rieske 2Fe-2S domain-containing protein [Candidatus Micrarchaeota archaeon]|nr:Rieske 2Fe-2S domain-containing protein [Candidatus Micrarchaeota archaeon]